MTTAIPLTDEAEQRIDFLVSQTGRSKAYYVREIIERGLEDLELPHRGPGCEPPSFD